jgi:hypothetical protein
VIIKTIYPKVETQYKTFWASLLSASALPDFVHQADPGFDCRCCRDATNETSGSTGWNKKSAENAPTDDVTSLQLQLDCVAAGDVTREIFYRCRSTLSSSRPSCSHHLWAALQKKTFRCFLFFNGMNVFHCFRLIFSTEWNVLTIRRFIPSSESLFMTINVWNRELAIETMAATRKLQG